MLPNLVVIGAQKSGTTSLYSYLRQHPQIWMSREKELNFFTRNWPRGIGWYEQWFPVDALVRGEASPSYTYFPHHRGAAERMASLVPEAKLIYLVRDPIERLVSDYVPLYAYGRWKKSFADTMAEFESTGFASKGRYWLQLEQYLAHFPPERILVVDHDSLRDRRSETLREIFRFLGVDETFTSPRFERVLNPAPDRRRKLPAVLLMGSVRRLFGPGRAFRLGRRVPHRLYLLFSEPLEPPVVDEALRARLVDYYAEDVARLRTFSGLAFDGWSM